jgi:hypothetical protein
MPEPVVGPPRWLVRLFVALAILAVLVEIATYAGVFGGGLESRPVPGATKNGGPP